MLSDRLTKMQLMTYYVLYSYGSKNSKQQIIEVSEDLGKVSQQMFPNIIDVLEKNLADLQAKFERHKKYNDNLSSPSLFNKRFDARFRLSHSDGMSLVSVRLYTNLRSDIEKALKWDRCPSVDAIVPQPYENAVRDLRKKYDEHNDHVQNKRQDYLEKCRITEYSSSPGYD